MRRGAPILYTRFSCDWLLNRILTTPRPVCAHASPARLTVRASDSLRCPGAHRVSQTKVSSVLISLTLFFRDRVHEAHPIRHRGHVVCRGLRESQLRVSEGRCKRAVEVTHVAVRRESSGLSPTGLSPARSCPPARRRETACCARASRVWSGAPIKIRALVLVYGPILLPMVLSGSVSSHGTKVIDSPSRTC